LERQRRQTVSLRLRSDGNGTLLKQRKFQTNQRDQELLGKQLRQLNSSPRNDGVLILGMLAVFCAGMALGSFLFANESEPVQIALNDAPPSMLLPNGTLTSQRYFVPFVVPSADLVWNSWNCGSGWLVFPEYHCEEKAVEWLPCQENVRQERVLPSPKKLLPFVRLNGWSDRTCVRIMILRNLFLIVSRNFWNNFRNEKISPRVKPTLGLLGNALIGANIQTETRWKRTLGVERKNGCTLSHTVVNARLRAGRWRR
jgi:hypothetical protein